MDLATSTFPLVDLVGHNQCGNESDLLSPCTSSSLSIGSGVLNPGTPRQTAVSSLTLPSYKTLVVGADGDVFPSNVSGNFKLDTGGTTGSLLYDSYSASDGFPSAEHCWRRDSSSCTFAVNDVHLVKNHQSVPIISSSCNGSGMSIDGNSTLPERELQNQHFRCRSGRILQNPGKREISTLSQIPSSGGLPSASHCSELAFRGNSTQITNQIAASGKFANSCIYDNFSNPLQKGFDQTCKQQKLQSDMPMTSSCGNVHPTFGFNGNLKGICLYSTQSNFSSNPAWLSNNLSFQNLEQAPQFNQVRLHQDPQYQKESVESPMPRVTKTEGILHGFAESKNQSIINEMSPDMQVQGFSQKINGQDMLYLPQPFLGGFTNNPMSSEGTTVSHGHNRTSHSSENTSKKLQDNDKQELLLLYYHARHCPDQEGACLNNHCMIMKRIIAHMPCCRKPCKICFQLRALLGHHRRCQDSNCLVCVNVRKLYCKNSPTRFGMENFNFDNPNISACHDSGIPISKLSVPTSDTIANPQPLSKRLKMECPSFENLCQQTTQSLEPVNSYAHLSPSEQVSGHSCKSIATGSVEEIKPYDYSSQGSSTTVCEIKFEDSEITDEGVPINSTAIMGSKPIENFSELQSAAVCNIKIQDPKVLNAVEPAVLIVTPQEIVAEGEKLNMQVDTYANAEQKEKCKTAVLSVDCSVGTKFRKPNVKGVSLVESFALEQVVEHMGSLKQWVGLSKGKVAKNQAVEYAGDRNSCQLCGMGDLLFEPPPIYCVKCYGRIKHNRAYHTMANSDNMTSGAGRLYLCNPCFNGSHGDSITYIGGVLSKAKLEKKRNDVQILELWVQCDKCNAWQHQICGLFNSKRNIGGQAEYTCPKCYLQEMEKVGTSLPHGIFLGAQDLTRSKLSDHLEQRLFMRLRQERQERAMSLQKNFDEVPCAEGLIVRVVSSVDKKLEVKQLFRQIFEEENYPTEFPYKSKAILLFQKIEGADVCLFGMYVQEYGSECSYPNQRRVCLAYLDSVKYFRPDIKAVTGEALRTFVYHEILIGYLDYCKKRGFTSCHIWSCPPLKQEDFILNCHPEIQKTPKPDKLREWYLAMIRKAAKENIVVENTKLYDFFFMPSGECKASVTAARLPYFDGDYWPGCAEDLLQSLQQIEDGKEPQKKGRMTITKRALKAARHGALTDSPSKDSLLMFKLGEVIRPMKDDLILVHLQHACNHCCQMIVSGKRWVCDFCKNFQLCDKCYSTEQELDEKHKHPLNSTEKHSFYSVSIIRFSPWLLIDCFVFLFFPLIFAEYLIISTMYPG
uniref:histone acetyltransferase n=1 Tax=Anthurium amnicola TaxID=1678845 RepID=A0A1D1XYA6_9ARAE